MMLIVSSLILACRARFFMLLTWQQAGLSILMLVMTALCFHWFNYFKARNFCISGILFLLTLAIRIHQPYRYWDKQENFKFAE